MTFFSYAVLREEWVDRSQSMRSGVCVADRFYFVTKQTSQEDDPEAEVASRVSTYGPKMRFHSRAPWETGEDEELDQEESSRSKKRHGGKKSWGLSSKSSSDPRPSTESTRSHGKVKQSLDVPPGSSNGGALLYVAHILSPRHCLTLNV